MLIVCILLGFCLPAFCTAVLVNENDNVVNSVIQFNGNPNFKISSYGYEFTPHAKYVVVFDKNSEYWVNLDNKKIERYSSYDDLEYCKSDFITKTGAIDIAESFIQAHEREIELKDFSLVVSGLMDGGDVNTYNFLWRKYVGDIEGPNLIFISINPTTGAVIHYINIDRPILVSLENKITQEEAEFIAINQFPGINFHNNDSKLKVRYDEKGSQRLIWECSVSGDPKEIILRGGIVHIDAQSGEVIRIDIPM